MRILLTGGTGYIGSHLVRRLVADGHECVVVSRSAGDPFDHAGVTMVQGDPTRGGAWQDQVRGTDAAVNLAGAPLVEPPRRWTEARKRVLRDSRIETTNRLTEAIARASDGPGLLLSGSAVGFYGDGGERELPESAPPGGDFLAELCRDWEAAALEVGDACSVTRLRTGLVVGPDAPFLASLLLPFRLGVGGPWGSGRQWLPWVQLEDVIGLLLHVLSRGVAGPVNLVAPGIVRVKAFARTLGDVLGRPAVIRAPALALRLALGEAADALLVSQRAVPEVAGESGYRFRYPELPDALRASV